MTIPEGMIGGRPGVLKLIPIADRHIETCGWSTGSRLVQCGWKASDAVHVVDPAHRKGGHIYEPACLGCAQAWPCDAHELFREVIRLRTVVV